MKASLKTNSKINFSLFLSIAFLTLLQKSALSQCPNGTISTLPYSENFEDNLAPFIGFTENSASNAEITTGAGNASSYGIVLEGDNGSAFSLPMASNVWTTNANSLAKASFCVDLTSASQATMNFDLQQGYYLDNFNTNLRLMINGVQVGADYRPNGATTNWNTYSINLTSYIGSTITISFESSVKYSRAAGFSTYNFIDNILVSTSDITAPTITNVTAAANNCTVTNRIITANISDVSGVVTKQIKFSTNFGSTWSTISMTLSSGTLYTGTIPAVSGTVLYYVKAIDPATNTGTSTTQSYTNGTISFGVEDFETGNASYFSYIKNAESNVIIDPAAGYSSSEGLILEGKTLANWTGANWSPTSAHFSSASFCADLTGIGMATLKFNLFQGYQFDSSYTNFRVTVNGTQVGPIYNPSANPEWQTIIIDLTPYIGGNATIALESSVQYSHLQGYSTYNYIDNVEITDADVIPPVITAVSQAANSCTATSKTVTADVNDNSGPGFNAYVNYSNNNGANWNTVPMSLVSGNTYSGTIPSVVGTVLYNIIATDADLNSDTSSTKYYTSGAVSFPYSETFESGVAPYWSFSQMSKSFSGIDSIAGNASFLGVTMSGTGVPGYITPNTSNIWTINPLYTSSAGFCVDLTSLTSSDAAILNFDLKQGQLENDLYTNLRVLANGTQIGVTMRPEGGTAGFQSYSINLNNYLGTVANIKFESNTKYSYRIDSVKRNYNYIDNINISSSSTSADQTAPVIANVTAAANNCSVATRFIQASIDDDTRTLNRTLKYSSNGGATWTSIEMTNIPNTTNFTATIPAISGSIMYYITSTDPAGNIGTSQTYYYSNGTIVAPFTEDFEDNIAQFIGFTTNSESKVKIDSTAGNGNYIGLVLEGNTSANFTTPSSSNVWSTNPDHFAKASFCVNLSSMSSAALKFDLKQGFDVDNFNTSLRVTVNGTQVGSDFRPSGSTTAWTAQTINLTSYVGSIVTIAFESSVKYSRSNGFQTYNYIDNINISSTVGIDNNNSGIVSSSEIRTYPNPTTGIINLEIPDSKNNNVDVTIYNSLGQTVNAKIDSIKNSDHFSLDISGEPSGIYFVIIKSREKTITKKVSLIK
jgi:hypothetical protein